MILFHKNESLIIESCQFRNGESFIIRLWKRGKYISNRCINLKAKELMFLKKMSMKSDEMLLKFCPVIMILKRPKDGIIQTVIELDNALIICMNMEAVLRMNNRKRNLNIGINRIEKCISCLKGGMITIHLKIYGTIIDVEVEERTRAIVICNLAVARMNVDPSS
jgi:hypothetical protein